MAVAWHLALLLALAGALLVNYLADRLFMEKPKWGPFCPRCGARLRWGEYALGLRPCPRCGWRWRPWVVVLGMLLATWLLALQPLRIGFYPAWAFLVYSALNTVLDLEHRVLSPPVELVAAGLALVFGVLRRGWPATVLGLAVGVAVMGSMYLLGRALAPRFAQQGLAHPEEPILGLGDVLLAAVLGAFLGWPGVLGALVLGAVAGGLWAMGWVLWAWLRTRTWPRQAYMPYAPFLLLGAWAVLWMAK